MRVLSIKWLKHQTVLSRRLLSIEEAVAMNEVAPVWMENSDGGVEPFNLGQFLMDESKDPWKDIFVELED